MNKDDKVGLIMMSIILSFLLIISVLGTIIELEEIKHSPCKCEVTNG